MFWPAITDVPTIDPSLFHSLLWVGLAAVVFLGFLALLSLLLR